MGPGKARETLSCARPRSRRPGTRGPKRRGTAPSAGRPGGAPGPRLAAGGEVPGLLCSRTSVPRGLLWPGTSDCTEREGEREAVLGRKRGARGTVQRPAGRGNGGEEWPGDPPRTGGHGRRVSARIAEPGSFAATARGRFRSSLSVYNALYPNHAVFTPGPRASLRRPGRRDGRRPGQLSCWLRGGVPPGVRVCARVPACVWRAGWGENRQCPWRHRSRLPIESRNRGAAGPCPGQKARTAQAQSAPAACSHAASNGSPDSGKLPCDKARKTQTKWRER